MPSGPSELVVRLDTPLPSAWPAGRGTAVFVNGACHHPCAEIRRGRLRAGDQVVAPAIWRAPRADLVRALGDPRAYRSGFWAVVPIDPDAPGTLSLQLEVELDDGRALSREVGSIEISPPPAPRSDPCAAAIAICMATHNPDPALLHVQIESLRGQTEEDWVCLIGDDGSEPGRYAQLSELVAGDARFRLSRDPHRLGPYRRFERLLSELPPGPELVALCDQDDRWHPEKLAVLRQELGEAQLIYSDQRVVDPGGAVLSPTMWRDRRNQWHDLASMVIANSVTGAAALMRREVVELALPFPQVPGLQLHDHWLATVALATGELRYLPRPLGDYVQHADAVLGRVRAGGELPRRPDARASYFYGFVARQVMARALLARCGAQVPAGKRRSLQRLIDSDHSPRAFAGLLLRGLLRARENLGTEFELARGIAWRALIPLRARGGGTPRRRAFDASCPAPTPETLGRSALGRWRANL